MLGLSGSAVNAILPLLAALGAEVIKVDSPGAGDSTRRLAAASDVVEENFGPGVLRRFGLAHDDLRAINQRLVMCSSTTSLVRRSIDDALLTSGGCSKRGPRSMRQWTQEARPR